MARVGVTYEQVAAVANDLYAMGVREPGNKAVRDELSRRAGKHAPTGSPNTIQRHLNAWRSRDKPLDLADTSSLPSQLAGDLARALTAAADEARGGAESRLALVLAEQDELLLTGERQEAQLDALTQELSARTTERDQLSGELNARNKEAQSHEAAIASLHEQNRNQEALLASVTQESQSAVIRLDELRAIATRDRSELQDALANSHQALEISQAKAREAEIRAASAEASMQALTDVRRMLETQIADLTNTVERLTGEALRTATAEAEASGLREQVQLLTETNTMFKQLMKASGSLGM